jgi:hypothetical protein
MSSRSQRAFPPSAARDTPRTSGGDTAGPGFFISSERMSSTERALTPPARGYLATEPGSLFDTALSASQREGMELDAVPSPWPEPERCTLDLC